MRWLAILSVGAAFLLSNSAVFAEDRLVPGQYATIEAAISAAGNGDRVIISADTYNTYNLDFAGKAITVTGENPDNWAVVEATVINCADLGRAFHFHNSETALSVLAGLTITDGNAASGGAILCEASSPTITKCLFSSNYGRYGGAIGNENSSPTITNCIFTDNTAEWYGGAIDNYQSSPTVKNCIFSQNTAVDWGCGGAIDNEGSSADITGCTFYGNTADYGGAIYNSNSSTTLSNCILWADSAPDSPEIYGDCAVSYSDVEGGFTGSGNIDADPCFADAGAGDFHLLDGSPCIDTGDPAYSPAPGETDIDGELRVMGPAVDMGADEFPIDKPIFKIWPTQFDFTAGAGGPNPASQTLSIRNIGADTLNWHITEACSWLEVAPASGQSTGDVNEVTLTVDVTGLGAGAYYCQAVISDPCAFNSPRMVDVYLAVQPPVIELSSQQFEFVGELGGPNPADQILTVRNSGPGVLNWQVTEDCAWLSAVPDSGTSTGEVNDVTLSVDIVGLSAGAYNCALTLSDANAENSPQIVGVGLTVQGPAIELSSSQFVFAAESNSPNPADQILTIRNSGAGILSWSISEDCNWLSVDPDTGSSTGETDDVNLSVDISGLAAGAYNCWLSVSDPNAQNSPQMINVGLTVQGPVIELSSQQLDFYAEDGGSNPTPQILRVRNGGLGTLNWQITENCNWLWVTPTSGQSSGEPNEVAVFVEIAGLSLGQYGCELTITDPCAMNSPQTVAVTLRVGVGGTLHVPSEYPTIQAGIDAALNGDTVVVAPGTYFMPGYRGLDFRGKGITVRSTDPTDPAIVAATIIDCRGSEFWSHRGFYFHSGEGPDSVVSGLTITNGYVYDNPAVGGGIYCRGSSPTIEKCVITGNTARGRLGIPGIWPDCDCDPAGADAFGGGIFCSAYSHPSLINCTISNNSSIGGQGAGSDWLCSCGVGSGGDGYGGGVFCDSNSSATLIECTLIYNQTRGANGHFGDAYSAAGNGGVAYGGAVYCAGESFLVDCHIAGNIVSGGSGGNHHYHGPGGPGGKACGGGVCFDAAGSGTITASMIANNEVTGGPTGTSGIPRSGPAGCGAGIYAGPDSVASVRQCQVTGNVATAGNGSDASHEDYAGGAGGAGRGGGICLDRIASAEIENCLVNDNEAIGGQGGFGVYAPGGSGGSGYGGGLYFDCASPSSIKNCVVARNTLSGGTGGNGLGGSGGSGGNVYGGGIYFIPVWPSGIENCTAADNKVSPGSGGDGPPSGPAGTAHGAAIYSTGAALANSIVWGNDANDGNEIDGSGVVVTYSDVQGGYAGAGNIDADPCFVTGPQGDYYLSQIAAGQLINSPCADAGSDTAASLGLDQCTTRTDGAGDEGIADMGYHYGNCGPAVGIADLDGDGDVDGDDYALFAQGWYCREANMVAQGPAVVDGNLGEWPDDIGWLALDELYYRTPNDINQAWFSVRWSPDANKIYVAVVVEDSNHVFSDEYIYWDASDRIELYSQGDAAGGSPYNGVYDIAQHYYVAPNTAGGCWATWALGEPIDPNVGLEYAVTVDGELIIYEAAVPMFDNYGAFSGGDTIETNLGPGHVLGFDVVVCTRWAVDGFAMLSENLMTGKSNNADQFARHALIDESAGPFCDEPACDLDGNGLCNFADLRILIEQWLTGK